VKNHEGVLYNPQFLKMPGILLLILIRRILLYNLLSHFGMCYKWQQM